MAEVDCPTHPTGYVIEATAEFALINLAGYNSSRSKQAPFPFVRDITVDVIAAAGDKLWKELVGSEGSRSTPMKINHVQLAFSGIDSMETGQRRIEGFFQKPQSSGSKDTDRASGPLSFSNNNGNLALPPSDSSNGGPVEQIPPPDETGIPQAEQHALSFVCERCGERIALPNNAPGGSGGDVGVLDQTFQDEMHEVLRTLRLEHDDFHFAQDLAKQSDSGDRGVKRTAIRPSEAQPSGKRRKKAQGKSKTEGIARFFAPK